VASKIIVEIWDADMKQCESTTAFDTVATFLAQASSCKGRKDGVHVKVHVPGSFQLSPDDIAKIDGLGIRLF
jgi:hypothetical protein